MAITPAPDAPYAILPANWQDLGALRHVERVCFPKDLWPLWDLIAVLTLPGVTRFKALADGAMVGFIAGDARREQGIGWINTVCVLPEYRRRGIATALLDACEAGMGMPAVRLSVRRSNLEAIRLYYRLGYKDHGIWPHYYVDGEDALVMEKKREP